MSKFIRSIGSCYVNNIGFDLYANKDGSATIRPIKLGHDFPRKAWMKFDSVEDANETIDNVAGHDTEGAQRVHALICAWL